MNLTLLTLATLGALAAASLPARADADRAAVPLPAPLLLAQAEAAREIATEVQTLRIAADAMAPQRIVKGAPYCAEAVHETVQWLLDPAGGAANRIVRQQVSRLCRDGEGRTRQELQRGARSLIYLHDPVAGESWVLDPERRTARPAGRGAADLHMAAADHALWSEYGERMREWARGVAERARATAGGATGAGAAAGTPAPAVAPTPPAPPTPPTPPTPVVVSRGVGPGNTATEIHVLRLRPGEGPALDFGPPPAVAWRAQALAPRGPGVTRPLGSKDIEGQRAHGERTTWTIPAGQVGNERPIEILREVWTSPELMLTLSSRDFDPRSGEVNYRLQQLRRGEPDAALMRVPEDYQKAVRPERPERPERQLRPAPAAPQASAPGRG